MNKPKVFNYRKAMDRITELEGEVIQLNLELQHLKNEYKPIELEGRLFCGNCSAMLTRNADTTEFFKKSELHNYCPVCGKKIKKIASGASCE